MPRALTLISQQQFAKSVNRSDTRSQITKSLAYLVLWFFLGTVNCTKTDEFSENFQGGGVNFNPNIEIADFETLDRAWIWLKRVISEFRICFFSTIVLRKIKTKHSLKNAHHTYLHMVRAIFEGFVSIAKNLQCNFPRGRRGIKGRFEHFRKFIRFSAEIRPTPLIL